MNNKLKLNLDDLSVESFDTQRMEREKGTVVGEELTTAATCPYTCDDNTCAVTCDDDSCAGSSCLTCSPSCWDTCSARLCYGGTGSTVQ